MVIGVVLLGLLVTVRRRRALPAPPSRSQGDQMRSPPDASIRWPVTQAPDSVVRPAMA